MSDAAGWEIRKPPGEHVWRYFVTENGSLRQICLTKRGALRYIKRQKRKANREAANPRRQWWTDPPIFTEKGDR